MWWAYTRGGLYSGGLIVGGLRYQSLQGITKHYERLTMVHEEVRRYTRTTFTMKRRKLKKDNRGKQIYSFFNVNIKFVF
jgi:hypothetical protein